MQASIQYSRNITGPMVELEHRARDLTPVMAALAEGLRTSVVRNFEVGGRYSLVGSLRGGDRSWKPVEGNPHPLVRSGMLRDSIFSQHTADSATVATGLEYAARHNFGFEVGARSDLISGLRTRAGRTEARPFLVFQDDDMEELLDNTERYLLHGHV
jgi:phage gpG-like protein